MTAPLPTVWPQLQQSPSTTKVLADFAAFKAQHDAKCPPYVSRQTDEEYEARGWAKPETNWGPF